LVENPDSKFIAKRLYRRAQMLSTRCITSIDHLAQARAEAKFYVATHHSLPDANRARHNRWHKAMFILDAASFCSAMFIVEISMLKETDYDPNDGTRGHDGGIAACCNG
jgi:hypothetical protein